MSFWLDGTITGNDLVAGIAAADDDGDDDEDDALKGPSMNSVRKRCFFAAFRRSVLRRHKHSTKKFQFNCMLTFGVGDVRGRVPLTRVSHVDTYVNVTCIRC
jgi:hypothetical protein